MTLAGAPTRPTMLVDTGTMTSQSAVLLQSTHIHTDIYTYAVLQRTAIKTSRRALLSSLTLSVFNALDSLCILCLTFCTFEENCRINSYKHIQGQLGCCTDVDYANSLLGNGNINKESIIKVTNWTHTLI